MDPPPRSLGWGKGAAGAVRRAARITVILWPGINGHQAALGRCAVPCSAPRWGGSGGRRWSAGDGGGEDANGIEGRIN